MSGIFALLQAAPAAPPPGFWQQNGDKVLVSIITAIVILILSEPIKALLKKVGQWLENSFAGLGLRFFQPGLHGGEKLGAGRPFGPHGLDRIGRIIDHKFSVCQ